MWQKCVQKFVLLCGFYTGKKNENEWPKVISTKVTKHTDSKQRIETIQNKYNKMSSDQSAWVNSTINEKTCDTNQLID